MTKCPYCGRYGTDNTYACVGQSESVKRGDDVELTEAGEQVARRYGLRQYA